MKAFNISNTAKVYAYNEPVSMARSFPGLSDLVAKKLRKKPESGDLFLFVNKKKNYCKILFFHKGGHCIFAKKLPHGVFDCEDLPSTLSVVALEKMINEVIVNGAKKLRHLKVA